MLPEKEKVRVDKWLWSVRIFKTRTLAGDACRDGKVKLNDKRLKPSFIISGGEHLQVRKNGFDLVYQVNKCIDRRVSATLASTCYENLTSEDELNKYEDWFVGKARTELREKGLGRPTKKERREIDGFKADQFNDEV